MVNIPDDELLRSHPTDEAFIKHLLNKYRDTNFNVEDILSEAEAWSRIRLGYIENLFFWRRLRSGASKAFSKAQKDWEAHGDSKPYIDLKAFIGEEKQVYKGNEDEYWKASGEDKVVYRGKDGLVGMRKTFVYNPPDRNLNEENWVMHEYRLEGKLPLPRTSENEWVLCKVFRNTTTTVPVKNHAPLKGCAKPVRSHWAPAGTLDFRMQKTAPFYWF